MNEETIRTLTHGIVNNEVIAEARNAVVIGNTLALVIGILLLLMGAVCVIKLKKIPAHDRDEPRAIVLFCLVGGGFVLGSIFVICAVSALVEIYVAPTAAAIKWLIRKGS